MWSRIKRIIGLLLNPSESFNQRVVASGFWVLALSITNRGLSLLRIIILARLLAPQDFGLLGIALITMAALEKFSEPGFDQALIQKKGDVESYLNTAWTIKIIRSVILFIVIYLISPYVAFFFETSEAEPIIQAIGLCILFAGFNNIGTIYFRKELEFHKEFAFTFSRTIVDVVVAVSAAIILQSVWALVYGKVASTLVACIVSYFIHPYRPQLSFDLPKARELFTFGKWILGSSILVFLLTQGDNIFVGKVLGAAALGFYQLAYRVSTLPIKEFTLKLSQVTFPAFSKLQEQKSTLKKGYIRVLTVNNLITIFIAVLLFFFSYELTYIVLGEKWLPIVDVIKVLSIRLVFSSINAGTGSLFKSVGKPFISFRSQLIKTIVLFSIIYPLLIKYGILGAAFATLIGEIVVTPYLYYQMWNIIHYSHKEFLRTISFPLISGIIAMLTIFGLKEMIFTSVSLLNLITLIPIAFIVYIIMIKFSEKIFDYSGLQEISKIKNRIIGE